MRRPESNSRPGPAIIPAQPGAGLRWLSWAGGCRSAEVWRCAVLIALALVIALFAYNRWTVEAWRIPVEYGIHAHDGDAADTLARIKAAAEGSFPLLLSKNVPQLGAPFDGNWNDIPIIEQGLYWAAGLLARVTSLFVAANAMVFFAHILAAVCFYLVCRALDCDWRWSFAAALVFAFARYPFARQLHHLNLLYYWHVPACLLVTWWLAADQDFRIRERRFWIAIAIAIVTGMQHPYYTNMFVQLTAILCLVRFLRGDRAAAFAGAAVIAASLVTFLLLGGNYLHHRMMNGANPDAVIRAFRWLEISALKPLDMIMPPPDHRFAWFAGISQRYFAGVFIPGEIPPSSYLGLVGVAALSWLAFAAIRCVLRRPPTPVPLEAWQVSWILLYSVAGGLNCFAGVAGFQLFRSSNRYSIFILAIALVYAVRSLSKWRPPAAVAILACVAAAGVACWDQIPPPPTRARIEELAARIRSDREFAEAMEARLPKGAMVFQLPVMEYPETPIMRVPSYDHFRPYLFTRELRYSYGSVKGRARDRWQMEMDALGLQDVVNEVTRRGFAAIYINCNGFTDRGRTIEGALIEMGYADPPLRSAAGDLVCIVLKKGG